MRTPAGRIFLGAMIVAAVLLLSGGKAHPHFNARFYRGDVAVSTSWEGVIRLTGTLVIQQGVTVSVEPGTTILVQPGVDAEIVVRGRLLVRGVPGKPVVFDTAGGCAAGPWGGIVFEKGSTGILEHATIRCAVKGIAGEPGVVRRTGVIVESAR